MPKHTQPTLPADAELVLPERVTIALAELAGAAREGLLALAVGTGLGVGGSRKLPACACLPSSASTCRRNPSSCPQASCT